MASFRCTTRNNPQLVHWFTDVGKNYGQWYLTLDPTNYGTWTLKPFHQSIAKFLAFQYEPRKSVGGIPLVQQQGDTEKKGIDPTLKTYQGHADNGTRGVLAAESDKQLASLDLLDSLFDRWIKADPRLFVAKSEDVDGYVLESLWYPGSYVTFDPKAIKGSSTPVFLSKNNPSWKNQVFQARDYGKLDGTQEFIFL